MSEKSAPAAANAKPTLRIACLRLRGKVSADDQFATLIDGNLTGCVDRSFPCGDDDL